MVVGDAASGAATTAAPSASPPRSLVAHVFDFWGWVRGAVAHHTSRPCLVRHVVLVDSFASGGSHPIRCGAMRPVIGRTWFCMNWTLQSLQYSSISLGKKLYFIYRTPRDRCAVLCIVVASQSLGDFCGTLQ